MMTVTFLNILYPCVPTPSRQWYLVYQSDLLMTDVPGLVRVAVVAPIGNSDRSSLWAVITIAKAVPNWCVSRKVFLKHLLTWNTFCSAIQQLPWRVIWSADNPLEAELASVSAGWTLCTKQGHLSEQQG